MEDRNVDVVNAVNANPHVSKGEEDKMDDEDYRAAWRRVRRAVITR